MKLEDLKKKSETASELISKLTDVFNKLEQIEDGDGDDCFGWAFRYNDDITYDVTVCFDGTVIEKFFVDGVISEYETKLLNPKQVMIICKNYYAELYPYLYIIDDVIHFH